MDQQRFDRFSRSLAVRSSRRKAIQQAGAGGLIGGLGAMLGMRATGAQGDTQTCALPIYAEVYVGPWLGTVYEGTLALDIDAEGAIDSGTFTTLDGASYLLVGEAEGRALDLRIDLGNDQLLTLTGTAERAFAICQGAAAGSFSGPEMGNMGTWTTTAPMTASGSGGPGITSTETPGAGGCAAVLCLVPMTPNPETCVCECPEANAACGDVCCAAGAECVDPSTGTCLCPDGTELCGEACVPACQDGESLDESCTCVAACAGVDCGLDETLNLETCECEAGILCAAGTVACGDICADLESDAQNCGSCGHACPSMPTSELKMLPSLCVAGDCCLDDDMLCATNGDCCSGNCGFISGGIRVCR